MSNAYYGISVDTATAANPSLDVQIGNNAIEYNLTNTQYLRLACPVLDSEVKLSDFANLTTPELCFP